MLSFRLDSLSNVQLAFAFGKQLRCISIMN